MESYDIVAITPVSSGHLCPETIGAGPSEPRYLAMG
jgi:hypothetical protein